MLPLVLRRLLPVPVVLLAASVLVFALPRFTGVDVTRAVLRARVATEVPDPVTQARVAAEFGLDATPVEQYLRWLAAALRGDLGLGFVTRTPVAPQLADALGTSALLGGLGLLIAILVGVPAGVGAASRPGRPVDRAVSVLGTVGVAVPEFVLAPWLVLVFAVGLGVLPAVGWGGPAHVVLPVLTLACYPAALFAHLVRAETGEVLSRDHVRLARARGLSPARVLWVHGARLALTSVTALSGMALAGLVGGSVVVEVVFGVPGVGRLLHDAVVAQDLPVIQAAALAVVAVAVVTGVLAEVLQLALDPVAREGQW